MPQNAMRRRGLGERILRWLGVLAALGVALATIEYVASESGEVVVLHTRDAQGVSHETRLWVVDHDGAQWLRAGNASVGWYARLAANPEVEIERRHDTLAYRAQPEPELRDTINERMQEKYGWADSYVCFFFPREHKIPVRLVPAEPARASRAAGARTVA
jgi:hypothetical protein